MSEEPGTPESEPEEVGASESEEHTSEPAATDASNEQPHRDEPLSARLGVFGKLDTIVYRAEMVVVVAALVLMSVMVFVDVAYQLSISVSQYLDKGDSAAFGILGAVLGFIGLIAFAATGDSRPTEEREEAGDNLARPMPVRIGVTIAAIAGSVGFGWALLNMESSTVYIAIAVLSAIPVCRLVWQDWPKFGAMVGGFVLAAIVFSQLPTGYSWSQSYSLIMLLWVSFLGASIAARERRHLRVDLARKLMPPDKLPWFNMVSYLVAAGFTAIVLYLGYIYIFGADSTYLRPIWDAPSWLPESTRTELMEGFPLPEDASAFRRAMQVFFAPSEPGELPDWLKVAAIPVSMLLICVRFVGHAIVFARMGLAGESYTEELGAH